MGRERQKHKNRSSRSKVVRKPKSKKQILSNSIIAANWDKSQTLAQNYQRLGLTRRLNKNTGGVQKTAKDVEREREFEGLKDVDVLKIGGASTRGAERLEVKEARIERDEETGRIVRVIDAREGRANPLNDPLNDIDSDSNLSSDEAFNQHNIHIPIPHTHTHQPSNSTSTQPKTSTVLALEQHSLRPEKKYKRKQSEGERAFIEELVEKYGDDYEKMARDVKINYMQRSAGDLKRRVKKWREANEVGG